MEDRMEKALANHAEGYNCAQAVVCAYSDLFGVEEELAFRVSEGFGGGIGGMHDGTCGAVTAMYLLAGMKGSSGAVEKGLTKADTYACVRALSAAFKEKNRSVICQDLMGETDPSLKYSCAGCIQDAAVLIQKMLVGDTAK